MASSRVSLLLLTLGLYMCTVLSDDVPVALSISNHMHSVSITLFCQGQGPNTVNPGGNHEFHWSVNGTSFNLGCMAFRSDSKIFVTWNAYQASRDAGHKIVYWLARDEGFYFSYNNKTWKKRVNWPSDIVH